MKDLFLGKAKSGRHDSMTAEIDLDKLFGAIAEKVKDNKEAINSIRKAYNVFLNATKDVPGFNQFERKDGKQALSLKLFIGKLKEARKYQTHYVKLNDYVPEKTGQHTEEAHLIEEDDNLPF